MNSIQLFTYADKDIRTTLINGGPWFVATDVCNVLDLSNPTMVIGRLDEDERSKFNLGRQGEGWCVTHRGWSHEEESQILAPVRGNGTGRHDGRGTVKAHGQKQNLHSEPAVR